MNRTVLLVLLGLVAGTAGRFTRVGFLLLSLGIVPGQRPAAGTV